MKNRNLFKEKLEKMVEVDLLPIDAKFTQFDTIKKYLDHITSLSNLANMPYVNIYDALLKVTLVQWYFSRFLNCTNGTKSRKTSQYILSHWSHYQCVIVYIEQSNSIQYKSSSSWKFPFYERNFQLSWLKASV